ncbi:MAG: hypothetical protein NTV86_01610 [Planctomycetota bacterium]|nr:hypothetical protein [Planctomycetota bacterium]
MKEKEVHFGTPGEPRRSRHVGAGSNISGTVGEGYGQAQGADVGAQPTHLHRFNGSFRAEVAVTAAGTITDLDTVAFACPVFRQVRMEVQNESRAS